MQIIIIAPGASASSKGTCVKHVKGRARREDCFEGDLTWGNKWNALRVMEGGIEGDLPVAGREFASLK